MVPRGCFLEIHETVFVVAWVCGVCGAVSEGRKLLHSFYFQNMTWSRYPRLANEGRLRLLPAKLVELSALRWSEPVRRATSLTTWLRCSTVMTPSCIAQSIASNATPSERTFERESMTDWLWWLIEIDMGFRGAKIGSSSNGSPSTCKGSRVLLEEVIVIDEHWHRRRAFVKDICANPSCKTPSTATTSSSRSSMEAGTKPSDAPGGVSVRTGGGTHSGGIASPPGLAPSGRPFGLGTSGGDTNVADADALLPQDEAGLAAPIASGPSAEQCFLLPSTSRKLLLDSFGGVEDAAGA